MSGDHNLPVKVTTQQQLADILGMKRQSVSHYCDGSSIPNIEKLICIAEYSDVTADYLLGITNVISSDINKDRFGFNWQLSDRAIKLIHKGRYSDMLNILLGEEFSPDYLPDYPKPEGYDDLPDDSKERFDQQIAEIYHGIIDDWNQKHSPVLRDIMFYLETDLINNKNHFKIMPDGNVQLAELTGDLVRDYCIDHVASAEVIENILLNKITNNLKRLRQLRKENRKGITED